MMFLNDSLPQMFRNSTLFLVMLLGTKKSTPSTRVKSDAWVATIRAALLLSGNVAFSIKHNSYWSSGSFGCLNKKF